MMTTFLEQFLKAHPDKDRPEQEKIELKKIYKPGDNVLPKLRRRRRPEDEDDRRLMEEVRQLSLQEVGVSDSQTPLLQPPQTRQRTSRSRSHERRERRQHRSRESSSSGVESLARPPRVSPSTMAGPPTARQVEHQASLRSLLSASEVDSEELEQEIMRQILEEDLLDGIDLDNIDQTQKEQIEERILQAFRRRRNAQRAAGGHRESAPSRSQGGSDSETGHARPRSDMSPQNLGSRPPVSRPHLFDAVNEGPRTRRQRTPSQGSSRSARLTEPEIGPSTATANRASRSANDLSLDSLGVSGSNERPRRASANSRRTTDPDAPSRVSAAERAMRGLPERQTSSNPPSPNPNQMQFSIQDARPHATFPMAPRDRSAPRRTTNRPSPIPTASSSSAAASSAHPLSPSHHSGNPQRRPLFIEPSITCDSCHRQHIEYFRHYNCSKCGSDYPTNIGFNLCLSCYRRGKGCHHWFGFSPPWASLRHARIATDLPPPQQAEEPHMFVGRRWRKPRQPLVRSAAEAGRMVTDEDPAIRLESGVFCDSCSAFANACYWKCDSCNDGAWGYCNNCTNQFKHCTHPLLPLSYKSSDRPKSSNANNSSAFEIHPDAEATLGADALLEPPLTPKSATSLAGAVPVVIADLPFTPQSFTTECDICHYPIPPSNSRYHCPECTQGDYDICTPCYNTLASSGRIRREDGPSGWRRCPKGHRMGIVGFEDREGGQRRIVVQDRVGGLALKEESNKWSWRDDDGTLRQGTNQRTPSRSPHSPPAPLSATGGLSPSEPQPQQRFPPPGGVGLIVQAMHAWWPEEGIKDELMFPRGAEIREAEDINGDWFWGCYAGAKGLFPGGFGKVIGTVE